MFTRFLLHLVGKVVRRWDLATGKEINPPAEAGWPLRDGQLAKLLERLTAWKPRAIGVDLYRDIPEPPGSEHCDEPRLTPKD